MRHVIIGNGPAGMAAARTLRQIAPDDEVVVISEEGQPFYSKVLTSYFVGGKAPYENMLLASGEEIEKEGIRLMGGRHAVEIDAEAKTVTLSEGERVAYDRLLIAAGAAPSVPPIEGVKTPGVFTLWTHDDAVGLEKWVGDAHKAVVIGGGLVGLKAAEAFIARGLEVTVVEMLDRVLPQVLVKEDADIVQRELERKGLKVLTGTGVTKIAGEGRVESVCLSDGSTLQCEVVVVATGVRPNLAIAKSAGIAVGRGILVDEFLRTSVADIYAAGDITEGWDIARGRVMPNPTWGNASEQGRIAAHNMAGKTRPFDGAVTINTFTFLGFRMAAVGITQPEGEYLHVESYQNPATGDYRKLITMGDRVVGGIAVGDVRMAGIWRGLIEKKGPDGPAALALLAGRTTYAWTHNLRLN